MSLCKGINVASSKQSVYFKRHVILHSFNYKNYLLDENCKRTYIEEYIRDSDCDLLIHQICSYCKKNSRQLKSDNKSKLKHHAEPAKMKAEISVISPDHLIETK